jgi:hypothetical protein
LLEISYFYGLGALIVFLGATALDRLSVRTVRDIECAQRQVADRDTTATAVPTASTAPAETPPHRSRLRGLFGGHHDTPVTR